MIPQFKELGSQQTRGEYMDRRRSTRYRLSATVNFHWKDEEGLRRQGGGSPRDVSEKGIFVVSDTCPPVGAALRLHVFFYARLDNLQLQMQAKAEVLRVEFGDELVGRGGFAALIKTLDLRNLKTAGQG